MSVRKFLLSAIIAFTPVIAAAQGCDDHKVRISCEAGKVWDEKTQGCVPVSS